MSVKQPIQVGDAVRFLNEEGGGKVVALLSQNRARIHTDEGFDVEVPLSSVVLSGSIRDYKVSDHHASMVASNDRLQERIDKDKGRGANVVNGGRVAKQEDPYVMEIDLHLQELVDDERHLDHDEKLRYQINYFERMLNTAIREHKRKLIVIHGIGEGVLREEVRKTLQYYDGVRFDDADP